MGMTTAPLFASAPHELTQKDDERRKAWQQHTMNAIVDVHGFRGVCWLLTAGALDYIQLCTIGQEEEDSSAGAKGVEGACPKLHSQNVIPATSSGVAARRGRDGMPGWGRRGSASAHVRMQMFF